MKYSSSSRGSALIEVLFSLFILTLGLTSAAKMIMAAIYANESYRNRIIAINLAQEGIEALQSIRNANWLAFSSDMRACWNFSPDTNQDGIIGAGDEGCVANSDGQNNFPLLGSNVATGGPIFYIADFNTDDFRWNLISSKNFVSGESFYNDYSDGFQLYKKDLSGAEVYTHNKKNSIKKSIFSRKISLYYIDNTFDDVALTGGEFPAGNASLDNRLLVISEVTWMQRGKKKSVLLKTLLTDYLSRTEWSS